MFSQKPAVHSITEDNELILSNKNLENGRSYNDDNPVLKPAKPWIGQLKNGFGKFTRKISRSVFGHHFTQNAIVDLLKNEIAVSKKLKEEEFHPDFKKVENVLKQFEILNQEYLDLDESVQQIEYDLSSHSDDNDPQEYYPFKKFTFGPTNKSIPNIQDIFAQLEEEVTYYLTRHEYECMGYLMECHLYSFGLQAIDNRKFVITYAKKNAIYNLSDKFRHIFYYEPPPLESADKKYDFSMSFLEFVAKRLNIRINARQIVHFRKHSFDLIKKAASEQANIITASEQANIITGKTLKLLCDEWKEKITNDDRNKWSFYLKKGGCRNKTKNKKSLQKSKRRRRTSATTNAAVFFALS